MEDSVMGNKSSNSMKRTRTDREDALSLETRLLEIEKETAVSSALFGKSLIVQEKLSKSLDDLSSVLTDMRLAVNSMQSEIKNHSVIIENMGKAIDNIKVDTTQISLLQDKFITIEKDYIESDKRIGIRIDNIEKDYKESDSEIILKVNTNSSDIKTFEGKIKAIDDKGKIDIIRVGRAAIVWIFAGGGLIYILQLIIQAIRLYLGKS